MFRSSRADTAKRAFGMFGRATIQKVDDSKKIQEIDVNLLKDETKTGVEVFGHYGFKSVPPAPNGGKYAAALLAFITGNRSHGVAIAVDDRRYRPKNWKPGEVGHYDDQKQSAKIARTGIEATAQTHTLTAGATKPETSNFELNEQLKGIAARMAQAEHNLHGLFDVTSRFREIVQQVIPSVAEVAPILNKMPTGLEEMASAIEGKAQEYLQKQVEQALQKFLSPNLSSLTSLLSGSLESTIESLKAQVEDLLKANPVIGMVDDLKDELSALVSSGVDPVTMAAKALDLKNQISTLTGSNPIIDTVSRLQSTLDGLLDSAGPAMNFLEPQKRLVQGKSKSLRLEK